MPPELQPVDNARRRRNANGRRRHWMRRLHRWLGIGALLFVIILSASGIALNHAPAMGLDQRYVAAGWLLDWYGIEAPRPGTSYQAGAHRVTQLGERLYFDHRELAAAAGVLGGAVAAGDFFAVAAGNQLLLASAEGELIERIDVATAPGAIERIGEQAGSVVVRLGDRWYRSDEQLIGFSALDGQPAGAVRWSEAAPIGDADLAVLQQLYRGRGVTGERLLADFHSGRLFGKHGPLAMDAAGVALLGLGISGLILFLRVGKRKRRG